MDTDIISRALSPLRRQLDRLEDRLEGLSPTSGLPRLLTRSQAADLLQVSEQTISRLMDTRQIPYIQSAPGAAKRIRLADLETWIEANTVRAIR